MTLERAGKIITITVAVFGAICFALALDIVIPWKSAKTSSFYVRKGEPVSSVAIRLKEEGAINSVSIFTAFVKISGRESDFKAGSYQIPTRTSIYELVKIFSHGLGLAGDIKVMIPEGSNVGDIDAFLSEYKIIEPGSFVRLGLVATEGRLFPDTYYFSPGTPAHEIATALVKNFEEKTREIFEGESRENIERALIIASLLEKEVRSTDEMRTVAGVIENRLEKDMFLALDASIAYGVCRQEFESLKTCDVSKVSIVDNLKKDSEYNVYMRKSLPPTPISNPGLRAIEAAMNPKKTNYYFYLSDRNGVTHFSKTAEEHEALRRIYIKNQ